MTCHLNVTKMKNKIGSFYIYYKDIGLAELDLYISFHKNKDK